MGGGKRTWHLNEGRGRGMPRKEATQDVRKVEPIGLGGQCGAGGVENE